MSRPPETCVRCVMDTTDPEIEFDEFGVCNHCRAVEARKKEYPFNLDFESRRTELERVITKIKSAGKDTRYDCVMGVSGGVDSTFVALKAREWGLRPLAVHLDNGWNSELAVHNIERICKRLEIDLVTHVLDWEEFRDLQIAFLRASTPDSEIPTDHAIRGLLYRMAEQHGLKYILSGDNFNTESILPPAWSHGHNDWKYVRAIHRRFGSRPLKTYPFLSYSRLFSCVFVRKIRMTHILDFLEYRRDEAEETLIRELGWEPYRGKHHESVYTRIFQAYILPIKFGFDKRKAHLSSLICAGEITRDEALEELSREILDPVEMEREIEFLVSKLGMDRRQFDQIMALPPRRFEDYPSYENSWYYPWARKAFRFLRRGARSFRY